MPMCPLVHQGATRRSVTRCDLYRATFTRRPARGRRPDTGSSQELQVALVVAQGASNREAAAQLFLSPKTIDFDLGYVYAKLGLRSRS